MPNSSNPNERASHIAIYGGFGYGNTGNDATLAITLAELARLMPGARVTVIAPMPEAVSAAHDVTAAPIRPEPRNVKAGPVARALREADRRAQMFELMQSADCLLIPGTGLFDDYNAPTLKYAYPLWAWCDAAQRAGAPVKLVSIGAGPVQRAWSRRFFRWAALTADHRSYRDEASRAFVRDVLKIAAAGGEAVTPDIVFAMDVPAPAPNPAIETVAVGTMAFHTWSGAQGGADDVYARYMDQLTVFCLELLGAGKRLRLITADPGDAPATEDLLGRLGAAGHGAKVSAVQPATLRAVCEEVARADAVVATRYHTLVSAMLCGRPAVSIGYAAKNLEMMRDFGQDRFCQNIWDYDLDVLRRHFAEATADAAGAYQHMRAVSAGLRTRVQAHFADVTAQIRQR